MIEILPFRLPEKRSTPVSSEKEELVALKRDIDLFLDNPEAPLDEGKRLMSLATDFATRCNIGKDTKLMNSLMLLGDRIGLEKSARAKILPFDRARLRN